VEVAVVTPALVVALLALAGDPQVEANSREILHDDRYWFCDVDDEGTPAWDARDWCDHAADLRERCPGFVAACARVPNVDVDDWLDASTDEDARGGGERTFRRSGRDDSRRREEDLETPTFEVPSWLRELSVVVFWLGVGAAVVFLAYTIARSLGLGRRAEAEETPVEPSSPEQAIAVDAARVVETDVDRLLARARSAAGRGDWEAAIADLYAALLRRLEGDGLIEVHPSRTNGDHLRDLRARPDLWASVAEIVTEVERVQFSSETAGQGVFERVWGRVTRLLGRGTTTLVVLLLAALTACPVSLREDEARPEERRRAEALAGLGDGPLGVRAVGELLWRHDVEVRHRLTPVGREPLGPSVLVVGDVELEPEEWRALLDDVEAGTTLFVAIRGPLPDELELGTLPDDSLAAPRLQDEGLGYTWQRSTSSLDPQGEWASILEGLELRVPIRTQLELRASARVQTTVLARDGKPYAVQQRIGQGKVVTFADDLLWTNASLAAFDDGTALVRLLGWDYPRAETLDIITFTTGSGADDPLESIANTRLRPLLLQLFLVLVLLFLARGVPFATLRDPPRRSRRAFAEHAEALADNYARVRASGFALSLYAAYVLERLRERVGRGSGGLWGLSEAVAARTGADPKHVMTILVEAHEARSTLERGGDVGNASTPEQHHQLMRELTRMLVAVTRSKNTP